MRKSTPGPFSAPVWLPGTRVPAQNASTVTQPPQTFVWNRTALQERQRALL